LPPDSNHSLPETAAIVADAFERSWRFIASDPQFAACRVSELQGQLSACLRRLASAGESDTLRLANRAIGQLRSEHTGDVQAHSRQPSEAVLEVLRRQRSPASG
jgi:uncharacterized membrane protein YccC